MIIDGTDLILGRLAGFAAKKAMLGERIDIVNCENIVITGDRRQILERYRLRKARGSPVRGPYFPRMPDMLIKRTIRGMLPYKQEKGEKAFKRVMCHIGVPDNIKDKKFETIEEANISKVPNLKYIAIKEICKEMGVKI